MFKIKAVAVHKLSNENEKGKIPDSHSIECTGNICANGRLARVFARSAGEGRVSVEKQKRTISRHAATAGKNP
jgi:hypothetical protein